MVSVSQFRTEKIVDVFQTIQIMRGQRPGIVGNSVRDNFVHYIPYSMNGGGKLGEFPSETFGE